MMRLERPYRRYSHNARNLQHDRSTVNAIVASRDAVECGVA